MQEAFARSESSSAIWLIFVKVIGVIAFLLATTVSVMGETIPLPRARPIEIPEDHPPNIEAEGTVSPCQARLAEIAAFKPLPPITGPGSCMATDVVTLDTMALTDGHRIALSPAATLRCPMAEAVTHWVRDDVAPAMAVMGKPLRSMETLDSFDCRHRDGVPNAKISEHGRANALDVRGFRLSNGVSVELADASVGKSLREKLRQSACARFSTVLGPGADAYHDSHVHFDLIERSSHYRICQWDVLDVTELAALAAKKLATTTAAKPPLVAKGEIPLPRPRPALLAGHLRSHHARLRESGSPPLFDLFAPHSARFPF